jgi:hypothetical protein
MNTTISAVDPVHISNTRMRLLPRVERFLSRDFTIAGLDAKKKERTLKERKKNKISEKLKPGSI